MPQDEPRIDVSGLLEFLSVVAEDLTRHVTLVAVGGTAMTLLGLKPSTRDIDFTGPGEDIATLKTVLKSIPHGQKVDLWPDGKVFSQFLPDDYLEMSIGIEELRNISLRALHPVDIVVTKIGRLDERDKQDIETCVRARRLTRSAIEKRAAQVEYVGNRENYDYNVQYMLRWLFKHA